jgi:hypothetical protein
MKWSTSNRGQAAAPALPATLRVHSLLACHWVPAALPLHNLVDRPRLLLGPCRTPSRCGRGQLRECGTGRRSPRSESSPPGQAGLGAHLDEAVRVALPEDVLAAQAADLDQAHHQHAAGLRWDGAPREELERVGARVLRPARGRRAGEHGVCACRRVPRSQQGKLVCGLPSVSTRVAELLGSALEHLGHTVRKHPLGGKAGAL